MLPTQLFIDVNIGIERFIQCYDLGKAGALLRLTKGLPGLQPTYALGKPEQRDHQLTPQNDQKCQQGGTQCNQLHQYIDSAGQFGPLPGNLEVVIEAFACFRDQLIQRIRETPLGVNVTGT
ncbi:hypothetical protein D3C84_222990 [compost metagenome]